MSATLRIVEIILSVCLAVGIGVVSANYFAGEPIKVLGMIALIGMSASLATIVTINTFIYE